MSTVFNTSGTINGYVGVAYTGTTFAGSVPAGQVWVFIATFGGSGGISGVTEYAAGSFVGGVGPGVMLKFATTSFDPNNL